MVFPNNMEYDSTSPEPLQGAFYVASSRGEPVFNYFREEPGQNLTEHLTDENEETDNEILADTNLASIKHTPKVKDFVVRMMRQGALWRDCGDS